MNLELFPDIIVVPWFCVCACVYVSQREREFSLLLLLFFVSVFIFLVLVAVDIKTYRCVYRWCDVHFFIWMQSNCLFVMRFVTLTMVFGDYDNAIPLHCCRSLSNYCQTIKCTISAAIYWSATYSIRKDLKTAPKQSFPRRPTDSTTLIQSWMRERNIKIIYGEWTQSTWTHCPKRHTHLTHWMNPKRRWQKCWKDNAKNNSKIMSN